MVFKIIILCIVIFIVVIVIFIVVTYVKSSNKFKSELLKDNRYKNMELNSDILDKTLISEGWIVKCNRNGEIKPTEEWAYIPNISWGEDEYVKTYRTIAINQRIPYDYVLQNIKVVGNFRVTDKNLFIFDKNISSQDYFMLICKDVFGEPVYYIYAPGRFSSIEMKNNSGYTGSIIQWIEFTITIVRRVDELVLPLPKKISEEISEETVTIPPNETRITYKKFDL